MRKGQVSIEYLLVMGFMFLLLVPLLVLYTTTQKSTQDDLTQGQLIRVGNILRDSAERVYYAGEPAQEVVQLYYPENIKSVLISNNSIIFTVRGGAGEYDLPISTLAPLNGTLLINKGTHFVTVRADDGVVQISE